MEQLELNMRAQIRHLTEYHYPQAASDSFNQVRLKPVHDDWQSLLSFRLEVQPAVQVLESKDYFGTTVHHFHVVQPHHQLMLEASSLVVKHPKPFPSSSSASGLAAHHTALYEFLSPSQRVPLVLPARLEYKALHPQDDLLEYLMGLNAHIKQRFAYQTGATGVHTPLEEFLEQGAGVCQDFAHAMLGVCRSQGIPARYVSGYVYAGQDFLGAAATHAWLEAYIPSTGWVGFDPTNAVLETENHIKIGIGRDYDDVPPLHGLRRGGGLERLDVAVTVQAQQ
jgi:transglutaminase-like putative cysteine protease